MLLRATERKPAPARFVEIHSPHRRHRLQAGLRGGVARKECEEGLLHWEEPRAFLFRKAHRVAGRWTRLCRGLVRCVATSRVCGARGMGPSDVKQGRGCREAIQALRDVFFFFFFPPSIISLAICRASRETLILSVAAEASWWVGEEALFRRLPADTRCWRPRAPVWLGQRKAPGIALVFIAPRGLGEPAAAPALIFSKKSLTPRIVARPERADRTTVDICKETSPARGGLRVA